MSVLELDFASVEIPYPFDPYPVHYFTPEERKFVWDAAETYSKKHYKNTKEGKGQKPNVKRTSDFSYKESCYVRGMAFLTMIIHLQGKEHINYKKALGMPFREYLDINGLRVQPVFNPQIRTDASFTGLNFFRIDEDYEREHETDIYYLVNSGWVSATRCKGLRSHCSKGFYPRKDLIFKPGKKIERDGQAFATENRDSYAVPYARLYPIEILKVWDKQHDYHLF